jgi:predicted small lipoprotein YifL
MIGAIQELPVTPSFRLRGGLVLALASALLLAACGKKGPLDAPPSAGLQPGAPVAPDGTPARAMQKDFDENGKPIAGTGEKKRFFLDFLLD